MNPNKGGEQPVVNYEMGPLAGQENHENSADNREAPIATPESTPSKQVSPVVPPPALPADTIAMAPPAMQAQALDDNTTTVASTPPVAQGDRIERQWVDKAKAIIAQTKDDPFIQKSEMSKVKAAYIEKRFNKKLRVDDSIA